MATTPVAPACPIRLVSFRLAARGSTEARRLFLDGEWQISANLNKLWRYIKKQKLQEELAMG